MQTPGVASQRGVQEVPTEKNPCRIETFAAREARDCIWKCSGKAALAMKKEFLLMLIFIAIAGMALFFDQALAALRGMSPLEMIQAIWTFILHVTVGTICATVIFGLPKIVQPWLKTFRWKQRQARRHWHAGPNAQWKQTPRVRMPRLNATLTLPRQSNPQPNPRPLPQVEGEELNIRW